MNDLLQNLDQNVKPLKQNLIKKGITGGDGNVSAGGAANSIARLGINLSPVSNVAYPRLNRIR